MNFNAAKSVNHKCSGCCVAQKTIFIFMFQTFSSCKRPTINLPPSRPKPFFVHSTSKLLGKMFYFQARSQQPCEFSTVYFRVISNFLLLMSKMVCHFAFLTLTLKPSSLWSSYAASSTLSRKYQVFE